MNQIRATSTTEEVLSEMGERLRSQRLQQNLTVAELAAAAGVGTATVVRAEGGQNTSVETLVRMLRALGLLAALDSFLPEPTVSPLQLVELQGRPRRRARKRGSDRLPDAAEGTSGAAGGGTTAEQGNG